ncbi:glycosyltransferase family 4 protein [Arthrobacter tumbae]|uniref:glycosyltransferase family 4 protein n=1 Tax=Arthrobacter tumbae TaxID=163874 RepID=UPI0019581578|nr:glycosyltransferase family 4 protein [Arthrobacter tumbae]MBM7779888.1 glycosyltransferase involved in cell wall biosynthesis [Arthrobacter tumbae]
MKRIAYVCVDPGVPVFGTKGASVHVQEIVRAWRNRGAEVIVYCTRPGSDVPEDLADLAVVVVPVTGKGAGREVSQAAAAAELAQRVLDDGADAVYERYSLFSDALARITGRLRVPGFLEVNAPLIDEQRTHRSLHDEAAANAALQEQVGAATRTVCVSDPVADWVRGRVDPQHHERIRTVANGVNVRRIRPSSEAPGTPVVAFVGTLKPWHGVETLIQAQASGSREWTLRIIGDGPQGQELRALAERMGADVDFTGAVAPEKVPEVLAGCSIAAAPYPSAEKGDQYFSPLKIYEYCAAGLPVVASRVGQVPHIIDDGVTGLLVEPSDPYALAEAIDGLASAPLARAAMSSAARRTATEHHSWDTVLNRITEEVPA